MSPDSVSVTRNDSSSRYELLVDGQVAGFAAFLESDTHIAFTHTEVDDAHQGKGLATRLAADALTDAVGRGKTIIPLCPYIARYLRRHEVPGAEIQWPHTGDPS
jgi:predicted GNAT family acetyltransferase